MHISTYVHGLLGDYSSSRVFLKSSPPHFYDTGSPTGSWRLLILLGWLAKEPWSCHPPPSPTEVTRCLGLMCVVFTRVLENPNTGL